MPTSNKKTATLIGFIAILLWSLLALFTASSGNVPPFQLAAITFAIGASIGVSRWILKPSLIKTLKQPFSVWSLGVIGLFGYHFAFPVRNYVILGLYIHDNVYDLVS